MKDNKAAIIIVNWNGIQYLKDCISSVLNQTCLNFEIYFVDNGSTDGSVDFVKNNYPNIKLICLDKNYGFAKGNNKGIEAALKDEAVSYIVLLNNDTIVDAKWLEELVATAGRDENIGAVGSKMIFFYHQALINTMGIVPLKNGNALNYKKYEKQKDHTKLEKIFAPCAGAALYKRKALEKVGLFDEDYFCYLEDVDLGYRLNLCGYTSYVNSKSFVYHIHSATSSRINEFKNFLIVRNSLYNSLKYLHILNTIAYPIITLYYFITLKKDANERLKCEMNTFSKNIYIKNVIKAYLSIIQNLPKLILKRKEIKNKFT
jgi:GT2 family glycosyltransferase